MDTNRDSDDSSSSLSTVSEPRYPSGNEDEITERYEDPQQGTDEIPQWNLADGSDSDVTIIHNLNCADLTREKKDVDGRQSPEANLRCDSCRKTYQYMSSLKRHIREKHDRPQVFECNRCPKVFVRKYQLRDHLKYGHSTKY